MSLKQIDNAQSSQFTAQTTSIRNKGIMQRFAETAQPYACGGLSAMFATMCVHPIDTTKVRIQLHVSKSETASASRIVGKILRSEGPLALYSGLSAAISRQAVYGTARLGLHRVFSDKLVERQGGGTLSPGLKVLSSLSAGAIASTIGNPFDIALVRMQADNLLPVAERRGYNNVMDALIRIIREEGPAKLWRGFQPNVCRAMAMNVGMMASYDQAKETFARVFGTGDSFQTRIGASALAGAACAATSLPFDLIKTRLQNMTANPQTGQMPYRGVMDCAWKIFQNEGPLAFWRGYFAFYARCAPHAMIVLLSMDSIASMYRKSFGLPEPAL